MSAAALSSKAFEEWLAAQDAALDPDRRDLLRRYAALVLEHNRKTNLTAAKDAHEVFARHLADGIAAAPFLRRLLADRPSPSIVDVGSGGGFIGIALEAAWPEAQVWLLESSHRKFLFLNWAAVELGLKARAVWARAEKSFKSRPAAWGPAGGFDAAVERALAPLEEALPLCVPLVGEGGFFVAYSSDGRVGPKAETLSSRLGAPLYSTGTYRLPEETQDRHLLAFRKG